ncbi:hypothetical protein ANAEL_00435 [Anaerolineales bacterium]|nr:hypothetical protein ANAEL_00435 [Anaerolineales bacterium]
MDLSIDVQEGSDYLVCTVTGKWVTVELESFIDMVSAELKKLGYRRILVDMSLVVGPPPEMDRHDIGKYIASVLCGVKTAVIYRKVLANNFFEDTAVNRGAWIKVFPDKQTALQWLMEGQIDKLSEDDSQ